MQNLDDQRQIINSLRKTVYCIPVFVCGVVGVHCGAVAQLVTEAVFV